MTVSIMVVDDESDVITLFQRQFRREIRSRSHVFHFATSAEQALAALELGPVPEVMLILSDINMPGMSGIELLQRVKAARPGLPVVMITAYDDTERRRAARDLGAAHYLTKPIDFGELKAMLVRMVDAGAGE